jgi:hypothetical protein
MTTAHCINASQLQLLLANYQDNIKSAVAEVYIINGERYVLWNTECDVCNKRNSTLVNTHTLDGTSESRNSD